MNSRRTVGSLVAVFFAASCSGGDDQSDGGGTAEGGTDLSAPSSTTTDLVASTVNRSTPTTASAAPDMTTQPSNDTGSLPVPRSTEELSIRACYNVGDDGVVAVVDCKRLHDGQVVRSDVPLAGVTATEPTADRWSEAASVACSEGFESFVGYPPDEADDYAIGVVVTSRSGTPPVVACTVVDAQGAKWRHSAELISGSYEGIDVGDCFNFPTRFANAREIPCDRPHEGEMYVVDASLGMGTPEAPYPRRREWSRLARPICIEPFVEYTGRSFRDATELSYTFIYPLRNDWADVDQRTMSCALVATDGSPIVGTRREG